MRPNLVRVLVGLAVGVVVLAGCSTGKQVADKIRDQFDEQVGLEVDVTCPKDAKAETAAAFDCTATYQSEDMTIHIVFTDDTHFTFTPAGFVAQPDVVAQAATTFLESGSATVDNIDCGRQTVFVPADGTFRCDVTSNGQTVTYTFTVDATGAVSGAEAA